MRVNTKDQFDDFLDKCGDEKTAAMLCIADALNSIAYGENLAHEFNLAIKDAMDHAVLSIKRTL